jgi:bifunctional enzyme CysN/CysC
MAQEIFKITSAGSVDDGKSTILARLLVDTGSVFDDQLENGFDPSKIADLLDGLDSEREQGITIDVAHRFFDSESRRYQVADSPGHEQYTRNMATACAGSDALLLVLDAGHGPKPQTFHHLEIALRLGIRSIIFAINKMDRIAYSKKRFASIEQMLTEHLEKRAPHFPNISFQAIPVSGLVGHNVVKKSKRLSWFEGPTLLEAMDAIDKQVKLLTSTPAPLFQVQLVQRIQGGGRRYLGRELSGHLSNGMELQTKSGTVKLERVYRASESAAASGQINLISIELDREVDIERGELVSLHPVETQTQFEADLVWLSDQSGHKGHRYVLKSGSMVSSAIITRVHNLDLDSNLKSGEAQSVQMNQIVRVTISSARALPMLPFQQSLELGAFILISPLTGQTIAVGTVNFALRRSGNITQQDFDLTPAKMEELTGNSARVFWFSGLSGSGKSTLVNRLSVDLCVNRRPHAVLDGDNLRLGINKDLGFTPEDRTENIRRTAEVAKLMMDSGLIVLVALVSPSESDREMARQIVGAEKFELVFVDTPLSICEERDPKGLYAKAREGKIPNFTGINAVFEQPRSPDWRISGSAETSDTDLQLLRARILD